MKKVVIIGAAVIVTALACTDVKKEQNRVYMPDMAYSRAYETYLERDSSKFTGDQEDWESNGKVKIFYNNQPVPGTVARNETYVYHIPKDRLGDSVHYLATRSTPNPLPALDTVQEIEAERLYLINCAICHGPKLDGNGPLYRDGEGPWPGQPAVLNGTVARYREMPPGQMYYSITYGKNLMGSYASQVSPQQRWAIVHYIKDFQAKGQEAATIPAGGAKAQSQTSATGLDTAKPAGIGNQQQNGNGQNGNGQNGNGQNTTNGSRQ